MKVIRTKKAWTDNFEGVEEAMSDLETLEEFRQTGEATEIEVQQAYALALKKIENLEFRKCFPLRKINYLLCFK